MHFSEVSLIDKPPEQPSCYLKIKSEKLFCLRKYQQDGCQSHENHKYL